LIRKNNFEERKKKIEEELKAAKSREYKIFKEEERLSSLPRTLYEKACRFTNKILNVEPDKETEKKLQEAIDFCHLKVTPNQVASLTILFAFFVCFPTLILIITHEFFLQDIKYTESTLKFCIKGTVDTFASTCTVHGPGIPFGIGMLIFFLAIPFTYYLYMYPLHLRKKYEVRVGSEVVTLILYMAMFMRNVPSLEGAVRFASENLSGPLGLELKKLMWDVEVGNYISMQEALIDYSSKWSENKDFIEALEILITSLTQPGERRISMLDEAVNIVLEGNREAAKHYNQKLKMPVMIVHAMGVILPIMGLVLFPVIAIFLGVEATMLFVGYDIILPMILFFVITNILELRPATFSKIDISENPDIPPKGKFFMGKGRKAFPAWPISLIVTLTVSGTGILLFAISKGEGIYETLIILLGIVCGIGSYLLLTSNDSMKVRDKVRRIESEFGEALFQLGNHIAGGIPIELAMERSMDRIKELKIKDLFQRALNNMRNLGLTFRQAFFDREYGAVRYYPSKLIKSVMHTVVESTKKGVSTAANAMLSVSRYLRGLHQTQEEVKSELNDVLNSLKFQALFLSPFISGVTVTMAIIMIRILSELGQKFQQLEASGSTFAGFISMLKEVHITSVDFILVVGIYLIETCILLSIFINGIENGEDPIGRNNLIGYVLIIGFIVFIVSVFITLSLFGPLATSAVRG